MKQPTRSQILIGVAIISLLGVLCVFLVAIVVLGVDQANEISQFSTLSSNLTAQVNDEASTLEPEIAGTVRAEIRTGAAGTFPARTPGARRQQ